MVQIETLVYVHDKKNHKMNDDSVDVKIYEYEYSDFLVQNMQRKIIVIMVMKKQFTKYYFLF